MKLLFAVPEFCAILTNLFLCLIVAAIVENNKGISMNEMIIYRRYPELKWRTYRDVRWIA